MYSYSDLFQQDRVQDGIRLYSKNAKNIFKEMQKVDDKIKEKQEKYNKKINENRTKLAEAIQAYAQKHRDDKNFNQNMLKDPDIKRYQDEMKNLETKLNNAVKTEQDKFMQWEKKEMKGQNVIIRNNNYISAAGKSNAIRKGLIGPNEIADFGKIDITNGKNETISGNLADVVHSVTNLLHKKAQAEKDETKKSEIEEIIQNIINGVKDFFGIQHDNKEQLEEQSESLKQAITRAIEEYLDNGFKQVKTNLEAIKQKDEQGKINYQSATKDISDLKSDITTLEKSNTVSRLTEISNNKDEKLDSKNNTQAIDGKNKQASTSTNPNTSQQNKNENIKTDLSKTEIKAQSTVDNGLPTDNKNAQSNENKNINTAKLSIKKEVEMTCSRVDINEDKNIKDAIQDKNNAIDTKTQTKEKELSQTEFKKKAQDFLEKESENKESELNKNNGKDDAIGNDDIDEEVIVNDDDVGYGNDIEEMDEESLANKIGKHTNEIKANNIQQLNSEHQTKNINISITKQEQQNNTNIIKPQLLNNGIKTKNGVQIGSGN